MPSPYAFSIDKVKTFFHYFHHFMTLQGSIKGLLIDWKILKTLGIGQWRDSKRLYCFETTEMFANSHSLNPLSSSPIPIPLPLPFPPSWIFCDNSRIVISKMMVGSGCTPLYENQPFAAYQMTFWTIFCIKEVLMQMMDLKPIISPIKLTTASQNILDTMILV